MADPLKQMCEELGVCQEEALFYLEGFRWDLSAAMEACRSKTLPSSESERAAAEERRRNELIEKFLEVAIGLSAEDAMKYLGDNNWSIEHAAHSFYADTERKSKPKPLSHEFSGNKGSDVMQDVLSKVPQFHNASMDLRIGSPPSASTPPLELTQESIKQFRELASEASPPEVLDCLNRFKGNVTDAIGYFYDKDSKARSGIATAQVVKNVSGMAVDQDSSTESVQHIPDAKPLVAPSQVEESGNPTQTLPLKGEESAEVKEEHIGSFVKMTAATREDAIAHLEHFKWNVKEAVKFFQEYGYSAEVISALSMSLMVNIGDLPLPSQSQFDASSGPTETQRSLEKASEGDVTVAIPGVAKAHDVKIQESSSPTQTREGSGTSLNQLLNSLEQDELIDIFVEAAGGVVTRDDATVYLTHSNWSVNKAFSCLLEDTPQVQASQKGATGSSSSSSDADPTETRNVTAAIPGVEESSQVDEDLGMELSAVPITTTTIELEIILDDGESGTPVWIFARSDQTVRDVRNRIDAFRPDGKRDYYLKSDTGVEYRDLDTTVHSITSGSRGSTILHQLYSS
ncbi:hypothetical protein Bca52824_010517 [Brassica carinata]|uniref:Uncharacterized protein n=1 Tax=Brassica carinata TaxID=52824 RepID=A0A8X8B7R4_BRACI|nr:hypothetical protein Bca52824_010517 [Brassica carinata]